MKRKLAVVSALALAPVSLVAADHFWIIGGGPTPQASEAQIELNVQWVVESIREMAPDALIHVFYANGDGPEPATVEHMAELDERASTFDALARVFGEQEGNRLRYREHRIEGAEGGTAADALLPELGRQLAALEPGDQGMIIYNGHGSWAPDRASNALRLWGESTLDVREFETLLSGVDAEVPIRFLFTQCYSGAFERAIHPGAEATLDLAPGNRCGFFAEDEDRLSEGCSASIKIGDYRDYTTFFFAALTGRTRLGDPVEGRRDWDGDGEVTPFDAHLYALVEGRNADLPRSTSEVYLERWQPWYLRWLGTDRVPDNLYGDAARIMAEQNDLPASAGSLGAELDRRYTALLARVQEQTTRQQNARARARALQNALQTRVGERWPTLLHPYTAGYAETLAGDLEDVSAFIADQPEYDQLVALQDEADDLTVQLMELDRDVNQIEKLRRTTMLARSLAQLERHGSDEEVAAYEQLRSCEALPLVGG